MEAQELVPWQQRFLILLPTILDYVSPAFRRLRPEARQEAVQEAVAGAYVAYARLVQRGKESRAFASVLAKYAVAQVRVGRQVGGRLNCNDVSSTYGQQRRSLRLARLDRFDACEGAWQEVLVEDERTPIPDQVAFRCDFPLWLDRFSSRDREIAEALAEGCSTSEVARRFGITWGRVSQLRRKFEKSWREFHGEEEQIERLAAA
jgi:transposase-like protein